MQFIHVILHTLQCGTGALAAVAALAVPVKAVPSSAIAVAAIARILRMIVSFRCRSEAVPKPKAADLYRTVKTSAIGVVEVWMQAVLPVVATVGVRPAEQVQGGEDDDADDDPVDHDVPPRRLIRNGQTMWLRWWRTRRDAAPQ